MNKKGDAMPYLIVGLAIAMLIFFIYTGAFGKFAGRFVGTAEAGIQKFRVGECQAMEGEDYDQDGLPDKCDWCLGIDANSALKDSDEDLMPDDCEPATALDPDKTTCVYIRIGSDDKVTDRLQCAVSACGLTAKGPCVKQVDFYNNYRFKKK